MSMMWPPHSVKIASIPSFFSALATRWPPEMVSAGSSVGRSFFAASAMFILQSCGSAPGSIEIVDVPLDMRGEVERVLADQPLGQLGVARLQRLDDVHVVDDRAPRPVLFRDRAHAGGADVGEQ